jgi:hypothetical protein
MISRFKDISEDVLLEAADRHCRKFSCRMVRTVDGRYELQNHANGVMHEIPDIAGFVDWNCIDLPVRAPVE